MEQGPRIRVVGEASDEAKNEAKKEIEKAFLDQLSFLSPEDQELKKRVEKPKSETEIALIGFVNQVTSDLIKKVGGNSYTIPPENIHIIEATAYEQRMGKTSFARAYPSYQAIVVNNRYSEKNSLNFGLILFHEFLHVKAPMTMEVQEHIEGQPENSVSRRGISVLSSLISNKKDQKHSHFDGLHEAIVSEAEVQFFPKILNHPLLQEQKKWLDSEKATVRKNQIAQSKQIPIDEIYWVSDATSEYQHFSYKSQRDTLRYVCAEIQKEFPETFQNQQQVFDLFLQSHLTGKLLEVARFVEKTFGKGSFRVLGNMDTTRSSGILHLETLRSLRSNLKV